MRITRIGANPRVPGYLIVEVDGARFASLPVERVQGLGLAAGETLDEQRAEELRRTARAEEAYSAAVRMLAARPRSVFEVMQRLRAKRHDKGAIAEVVGRLEEKRLLNDEEFARYRRKAAYREKGSDAHAGKILGIYEANDYRRLNVLFHTTYSDYFKENVPIFDVLDFLAELT